MLTIRLKQHFRDPYNWAKLLVLIGLASFFQLILFPAALSMWKESNTIGSFEVTPGMQVEIVEALADNIDKRYLDGEKAARIAAELRRARLDGKLGGVSSPSEFARILTAQLLASSGDEHIRVVFRPEEVAEVPFHNFPPARDEGEGSIGWLIDRLGRYQANFGVEKVDISNDGVGYFRLDGFFRSYLAAEKFAAAMNKLAPTKALIIDLRNNGGGSPEGVALLASYFLALSPIAVENPQRRSQAALRRVDPP